MFIIDYPGVPDSRRETLSQSKIIVKSQSTALDEDDVRHVAVVQENGLGVLTIEGRVLRVLTKQRPVFRVLTNHRTVLPGWWLRRCPPSHSTTAP